MISITKRVLIQALDCGLQGTVIVDARKGALPIVYVNPAIEELTGLDTSDLIGSSLREHLVEGELPTDGVGENTGTSSRVSHRWRTGKGQTVNLEFRISPLYERPGRAAFWLLTEVQPLAGQDSDLAASTNGSDAATTEALRAELNDAKVRLRKMQNTDASTGLPNRRAFLEILQRDWSVARREQRRLALLMFRIDAFDEYRKLFGRHATDAAVRKVAHAINGSLRRSGDFAARFDRDRFVVIIGGADEQQAANFAGQIGQKVRDLAIHHPRSQRDRFVTVSRACAVETPAWTAPSSVLVKEAERRLEESSVEQGDKRQAL